MPLYVLFFFFNDTATTEIYTLSLHDALPICSSVVAAVQAGTRSRFKSAPPAKTAHAHARDRKSTRLNSSHLVISYAVFCLKKKKKKLLVQRVSNIVKIMSLNHDDTVNPIRKR